MRRFVSLTAALSFLASLATSIVLYIAPKGRVAYWADWSLAGLSKEQWGELHINLGTLFLAALALHIWYNWKPLVTYLKDKARTLRVVTPQFNLALALTLFVAMGTLGGWPPLSWIIDGNTYFQDHASREYGEPPYGHAELSTLATFCQKVNLDIDPALMRIKEAGIDGAGEQSIILDIAKAGGLSPKELFAVMRGPQAQAAITPLPATPPPGTGRMRIIDLCNEYGLGLPAVTRILRDAGIKAEPNHTVRQIAEASELTPQAVYSIIHSAQAR